MYLLSCGINHKSANISIREQIAFDQQRTHEALQQLLQEQAANEAVLLSTCNRTELYATTNHPQKLKQWFLTQYSGSEDLSAHCYGHHELACVRHLMRVACGLDSMVLGEPQILGQIKQAYQLACDSGSVGPELKQLFPAVFSASKYIRHHSNIGANPVTLAYAIIQLGKRIFSQLNKSRVLLIGAGTQIELIVTHLHRQGIQHFVVANRHLDKAQQLASNIQGQAIQLSDIPMYLPQIDVVVCATNSPLPLIGKGMIESVIKQRKHRPMLMVDLAVPRDIEAEVSQLEDIYLYNIDDLQEIITANWQNRSLAAAQAESMIEAQAEHFMRKLRIHHAGELIQQFRQRIDILRQREINKALRGLQQGQDPRSLIDALARNLTNKILHQPTIKLRQAAAEQQQDILQVIKELLA